MNKSISDVPFEGNLSFLPKDRVVLEVVLPLDMIRGLVRGGENRFIEIKHEEIVQLLACKFQSPNTSAREKDAIKGLLREVQADVVSPEQAFVAQVLQEK